LIIRPEKPTDYPAIHRLVKVAFETAQVSNGQEQDFVDKLRASPNYIPELALVAEENGEIIGHIMLTKTYIANVRGPLEALLIAPLAVALEHRKRGIGSKLVWESFELAKKLGYTAVFVVGNPAYYSRFGFKSSVYFGVRHVPEIAPQYVMATELTSDGLLDVAGTVNFT
jgi:predicted N-acetyltransferase YhbS